MKEAIYYREHYYSLPDSFNSFDDFLTHVKSNPHMKYKLNELSENTDLTGSDYVEKGISFAPYFIENSFLSHDNIVFENPCEIYPVDVDILSQEEYNSRLREVICEHCPGCLAYKPLSKNVRSLNGHFNEISLDKVCFLRYETKPSPRYMLDLLHALGGSWYHHSPKDKCIDFTMDDIKTWLYIKYESGDFSEENPNIIRVSHKKDTVASLITAILSAYTDLLDFMDIRIRNADDTAVTEEEILELISDKNAEKLCKSCKKHGFSIGIVDYDPKASSEIRRSLSKFSKDLLFYPIIQKDGRSYFVFTDTPQCLKELHFRFPLLEKYNTKVTVYSQYGANEYTVSRTMPSKQLR